jgi:putative transposase
MPISQRRWKKEPETFWLEDASSQALQQSLKDLEDAWDRHFESLKELKAGKIKASQASRSAAVQEEGAARQAFAFRKDSNSISKTAECSYRSLAGFATATARRSSGEVRSVTVRQTAGKWFISILTKREVAPPVHPSTSAAGIDMGVVRFATLSVRHIVRWSIHRAAQ